MSEDIDPFISDRSIKALFPQAVRPEQPRLNKTRAKQESNNQTSALSPFCVLSCQLDGQIDEYPTKELCAQINFVCVCVCVVLFYWCIYGVWAEVQP